MEELASYQTNIAIKATEFVETRLKLYLSPDQRPETIITKSQRMLILEGMNPAIVGYIHVVSQDSDDSLSDLLLPFASGGDPPTDDMIDNARIEVYKYRKRFGLLEK